MLKKCKLILCHYIKLQNNGDYSTNYVKRVILNKFQLSMFTKMF